MGKIFKIFTTDAKRISSNVVAVVIILGLSILPSLYAWFNIFSNWDPYGPDSTGNIKVAVISVDNGAQISGLDLNIGDTVIEGLEANRTIGWVFTDDVSDTIAGVEKGDYYAALVIPENFTENMISFINGEIEHPTITYYENEKKNAIAPKITQKAWKALKQQVNSSFVSTLAQTIAKVSNTVAQVDADGVPITDAFVERLDSLSSDMETYVAILSSFGNVMVSANGIISTTQLMLPNIETMMSTTSTSLKSMQSVVDTSKATVTTVSNLLITSLDMINTSISTISTTVETNIALADAVADQVLVGFSALSSLVDTSYNLFNATMAEIEPTVDDTTKAQIQTVRDSFVTLKNDTDRLGADSAIAVANNRELVSSITNELKSCQEKITALENNYTNNVSPKLNATINYTQSALNSTINALSALNTDFDDTDRALTKYSSTLESGNTSLNNSLALANELLEDINSLSSNMTGLDENENYNTILNFMNTKPEELGDFVASPVALNTVALYPIENYGSAMAPFYTVLGLWVGALILVAIIHVHVHPIEEVAFKPRHAFFGRYITFFLVGQIQALITVFGDLFFIQIQCEEPFLFWLAASVSSFVFTIFIYSLTVAFGNIGEAIAIIVMVIQVAGAGCTFPIETLPKVFHYIYDILPFQFAMNALKEAVGGLYGSDYWHYLMGLIIYVVVSLFIGLVCGIPFRKMNHLIEKSKEKSGLMI